KRGVEVGFLRRRVAPDGLLRSERRARLERISPLAVDWRDQFVDRRIISVRPVSAVIEDQQVALTRQAARDPLGVVLGEERLVCLGTGAVDAGVSPSVEQIATLA